MAPRCCFAILTTSQRRSRMQWKDASRTVTVGTGGLWTSVMRTAERSPSGCSLNVSSSPRMGRHRSPS